MAKLIHYRLCPFSRSIRLALAETGVEPTLVEERPWEWRAELLAINPAGELPVLQLDAGLTLCGTYAIAEYLGERPHRHHDEMPPSQIELFPGSAEERAEVRRLVDWFQGKFAREVSRELLDEKLYLRLKPDSDHTPSPEVLRAVRANLRYHLSYVAFLAHQRRWLAGEELSFADLAAAAHLSSIDYLGEVPWEDYPSAKTWYARLKSRRAFRALLSDRIPGTPPPSHYADLDF